PGGARLILRLLGVTDFPRGRIAPRLRLLGREDGRTAILINRKQRRGHRRKPPALQRRIEGCGIVADRFDVVHGKSKIDSGWGDRSGPSSTPTDPDLEQRRRATNRTLTLLIGYLIPTTIPCLCHSFSLCFRRKPRRFCCSFMTIRVDASPFSQRNRRPSGDRRHRRGAVPPEGGGHSGGICRR